MGLDRWLALIMGAVFLVYGYTAFLGMDHLLPPILRRDPVLPSTFPKILSVFGLFAVFCVLTKVECAPEQASPLPFAKWRQYKIIEAVALLVVMGIYALALRPLGFMLSTVAFLVFGGILLGERRLVVLFVFPVLVSYIVWQLLNTLLGVHLPPYPIFLGGG